MPSLMERWKIFKSPSIVNVYLSNGDASTQVLNLSAKQLYQTQDNLRAVIDFLSNSIAQLPLKVYVRDGESERRRDRDSIAAKLLWKPNEDQTSFEFIRALAIEYFVFGSVFVWLLPDSKSDSGYQLRIVPTDWIVSSSKDNAYASDTIRICAKSGGTAVDVPRTEFIQFRTYSAGNPGGYISPISALRQTLTEQVEAGRFRKQLWHSSGRLNAQITRPANVQPWDDETRKKFATAFREAWGAGGSKAGSIPIMEDGMKIEPFSTSFKESEWAASVKLSRESVAAAYGVNPSLIWHSDTQTYASSKDNARALYAECLGPVLQMFQQRINSFLLPMIGEDSNVYVEFDLQEKLKGSFEERASILQSSVGGPWLSRNEARADMNLPPIDGGDDLIVPLNVLTGGQASPQDSTPDAFDYPAPAGRPSESDSKGKKLVRECNCEDCKSAQSIRIKGLSKKSDDEKVQNVLKKFFERQQRSVVPKINSGDENFWNEERWNNELYEDLLPILREIEAEHGADAADILGWDYSQDLSRAYIEALTLGRAKNINSQTLIRLRQSLESLDMESNPDAVFENRITNSENMARSAATQVSSFAAREAAHQAISNNAPRVRGRLVFKEWVTGPNSRPSHEMMDGQQVPLASCFSNGMYFPGDTDDPAEGCGCNCSTEVIVR